MLVVHATSPTKTLYKNWKQLPQHNNPYNNLMDWEKKINIQLNLIKLKDGEKENGLKCYL
jgi:hypothetical protein